VFKLAGKMSVVKYAVVVVLMLSGCNSSNRAQTYDVSGSVQFDGQPLTSGMVVFMPDKGQAAKGAIGLDGSFKLGTYGVDDGAVAGHYKVMVIAVDRKTMQGGAAALERPLATLIPARYGSTTTSGLAYEVAPDKPNVAHFALSAEMTP
jgi:hypothetical protein